MEDKQKGQALQITENTSLFSKQEIQLYKDSRDQSLRLANLQPEEIVSKTALWLRIAAQDLGVEYPGGQYAKRVAVFLAENYSGLSFKDLKRATDWYITGKLHKAPEPYGKLSLKFICGVLNKYKEKRGKVVLSMREEESKASYVSPDQLQEIEREYWELFQSSYEKWEPGVSAFNPLMLNLKTYEALKSAKLITLSKGELLRLRTLAHNVLRSEAKEKLSGLVGLARKIERGKDTNWALKMEWVRQVILATLKGCKQSGHKNIANKIWK